jgi:mRNA-degrading endonuclease RelE of RelBE toxin-antitoxin system
MVAEGSRKLEALGSPEREEAMNVIITRAVHVALRTLDNDERRKVQDWFDHLRNWEDDEHVREIAKKFVYQNIYSIYTPDDIRIFFALDEEKGEIVIVDLARPSRFKAAGAAPE